MSSNDQAPDFELEIQAAPVCTATYSDCGKYRFTLKRIWDHDKPVINFLMLNPSTATEYTNDRTVAKVEMWAKLWRYGGFIVTNLFALRETDRLAMMKHDSPVGEGNDEAILEAALEAGDVVCAWGADGGHLERAETVLKTLEANGVQFWSLKLTVDGHPWHPLYLPNDTVPTPWFPLP